MSNPFFFFFGEMFIVQLSHNKTHTKVGKAIKDVLPKMNKRIISLINHMKI